MSVSGFKQNESLGLEDGLGPVVPCNSETTRRMSKLVRDIIMVDETIVATTRSVSAAEKKNQFHRVSCDHLCDLRDMSKKDIVHCSERLRLQAVTLKGGQSEHKVTFKMSSYISARLPAADEDGGQTVVLSITNSNLHVCCSMKDGRAVLRLEECSEKDLQTISSDGNMDRFLFYMRTTGLNVTSFESVKCRRWFISTAYEAENQPVEMCEPDTARRVINFHMD